MKEIYFAGGCYWGTEHYMKQIHGVTDTAVGFANGEGENPTYEEVYTDKTGFAETVRVRYDEAKLPLKELVEAFFVSIDPLSLNRQGMDCGTRYRSGVYYTNEADGAVVKECLDALQNEFEQALAVELLPLQNFYEAEERHQDYLDKNIGGYCHLNPKLFLYPRLLTELKALLGDESDALARTANAAAMIAERMRFFWTGFYFVKGDELVLGPFCGPVACMRIKYGRGVCGACWERKEAIVVPDVEKFKGHIACSTLSKSEIVLPLFAEGQVVAVLDIDSDRLASFDRADRYWLSKIAGIIL